MSDKKNRKYKSDFGLSETKRNDDDEKPRSKKSDKYDEDRKSRSKDESKKRHDEDSHEKSRHRSKAKEERHRSSKYEDEDYEKSKSKHRSKNSEDYDDRKKSHSKPSKYDEPDKKDSRHRTKDDEKSRSKQRSKHRDEEYKKDEKDDRKKKLEEEEVVEEYNYDDDFDDDFENDSEEEVKQNDKEADERKSSSKSNDSKQSRNEEKRSMVKYEDYDDYRDIKGRVVKANAVVRIPTDSVEVFSSKIYFNHDSGDRQRRRAKDLFKNLIDLDRKNFSLLDINPIEMRTAYSAHLRHEKIQTNDDNVEIDCQTDDIDYVTRWTQNPPDDSKGYGTENEKFRQENSDDILQKFRVSIDTDNLLKFLEKSSKVIEKLIKNDSESSSFKIESTKSDLEMSQGFTSFEIPKKIAKFFKHFRISNCTFNQEDPNYIVCSYNLPDENSQSSLLLVWNLNEPKTPHRILTCETISTCLNYVSFMALSGNLDGSICLWDLRESNSMHSFSSKSNQMEEGNTVRLPTYTTAGVFINENHMSEVRTIINLQNQSDKNVFMQIATLEIEARLIIWTVIEIKNSDLTVFETDLGLLPGGKLKLVKSSQIALNSIIWSPYGKTEYQTLNMTNSLLQPNHFFIATNI
ncbi:WD repeat-containing 60, partial [Brachionus plicatilis]